MRVGAMLDLLENTDADAKMKELTEMGMNSCQVVCWNRKAINDMAVAQRVNEAAEKYNVTVTALWCGWEGPRVWDLYEGQETLGLIPPAYRFQRFEMLVEGSDFAKAIHTDNLVTHVGYMPENPYDENYFGVLPILKELVKKCKENGQNFLFETGQETPVTLKRAIQDIGYDNVGINLDPANLILYGKANPVDALDVFGEYVMGVHGKDGLYPTNGHELGMEVPLGQGKVNFPALINKLHEVGYKGDITIEREITGAEQKRDIISAKKFLDLLIEKL